jgi:hypothetical protein
VQSEVEERHEQHAAADAEQRAEAARDGAGREDDRGQRGSDDRHQDQATAETAKAAEAIRLCDLGAPGGCFTS